MKKIRLSKVFAYLIGLLILFGLGYWFVYIPGVYRDSKICNEYPAMGGGFFRGRCECDGSLKHKPEFSFPGVTVDPSYTVEYCIGNVEKRYFVFDSNWGLVDKEIGEVEVKSKGEALALCERARGLVENERGSGTYGGYEGMYDECVESAEEVF